MSKLGNEVKKQQQLEDEKIDLLEKAKEAFEETYDVEIKKLQGQQGDYWEDGRNEEEIEVIGLIESKTNKISFEVSGWITHDIRDGEDNIHIWLGIKFNGEDINIHKALMSWYDVKDDKWSELSIEHM